MAPASRALRFGALEVAGKGSVRLRRSATGKSVPNLRGVLRHLAGSDDNKCRVQTSSRADTKQQVARPGVVRAYQEHDNEPGCRRR